MMDFRNIKRQLLISTLLLVCLTSPVLANEASLLFSPSNVELQDNSEVVISIMLNTAGVRVNGAGAKITFNPAYLTAVRVQPSDIFADYPAAIIDNKSGRITISGISSSAEDLFIGEAKFADVVFRPSQQGTSKVQFVFVPGSTTDSNIAVMTGNGDILARVNELTVVTSNPVPGGGDNTAGNNSSATSQEVAGQATSTTNAVGVVAQAKANILSKIKQSEVIAAVASFFGWSSLAEQYAAARPGREAITQATTDPLAPIVRQQPITDPLTMQPAAVVQAKANFVWLWLIILLLLLGVGFWWLSKRKKEQQISPDVFELPTQDLADEGQNSTLPPKRQ